MMNVNYISRLAVATTYKTKISVIYIPNMLGAADVTMVCCQHS